MSWIAEDSLTWYQKLCVNVLKCGPIPKHVAFIMDGNRRYAVKEHVEKVVGHSKGFDKLSSVLQWCREMGVHEVTVYAFSIENFKRSKEEVDTLMALATEKFKKLLEEKDKLAENGICVRVIGNISLIPEDLRKLIAEAVVHTKRNDKAFLNVAFAYTSHDEITHSIQTLAHGVKSGEITKDDIRENLISECMYTNKSPKPDILVRTSGEVRFSDFLLWQIWNTNVKFVDVLWPDFNFWHFLACIFQYQRSFKELQIMERQLKCDEELNERSKQFVARVNENRMTELEHLIST